MRTREEIALSRLVGERLRFAREELCGWKLQRAAAVLGYSNVSTLAKIEAAHDENPPRLIILYKLAKAYEVSAGFLLGLSDDFEVDPVIARERGVAAWMDDLWHTFRARDMAVMSVVTSRAAAMEGSHRVLAAEVRRAVEGMAHFLSQNPDFLDLPGFSQLFSAVDRLGELVDEADAVLARHRQGAAEPTGQKNDIGRLVDALADLPLSEYRRVRDGKAAAADMRPSHLDALVEMRRRELLGGEVEVPSWPPSSS